MKEYHVFKCIHQYTHLCLLNLIYLQSQKMSCNLAHLLSSLALVEKLHEIFSSLNRLSEWY